MQNFEPIDNVPGLYIVKKIINKKEQQAILRNLIYTEGKEMKDCITAKEFGWVYRTRKNNRLAHKPDGSYIPFTENEYLGEHPIWLKELWQKILERTNLTEIIKNAKIPEDRVNANKNYPNIKLIDNNDDIKPIDNFDHAIVNTYEKDKTNSLAAHYDDCYVWDNWVIGLSMGADVYFNFANENETEKIFIPKYSVYLMTNDARYKYTHEIPTQDFNMSKRVSITFRNINSSLFQWRP